MLVVLPDQVNALADSPTPVTLENDDDWDESLRIVVDKATYIDYDNDGYEDDILTIFKIITPDDDWESGKIDVSCAVQKPSGGSLAISFSVKTEDGVEITIVWFNFADEAGWYTLYIKAATVKNDDVGPAYIAHKFDPPGGKDNMPPGIDIIDIEEL
jgi:hypothetical protein